MPYFLAGVKGDQNVKDMHRNDEHEDLVEVVCVKRRQVADDAKRVDDWNRVPVPLEAFDEPAVE